MAAYLRVNLSIQPCRRSLTALVLAALFLFAPVSVFRAQPWEGWLNVVRDTPYWESRGVATNLVTVRRWVLFSESYCAQSRRHLLLDRQWRFLGYLDDGADPAATNTLLNDTRRRMAEEGRVEVWHPGDMDASGYPFALACHQPFVELSEAMARLTGEAPDSRLWGTWDGISVGAEDEQVPLLTLFREVVAHRRAQERLTFPESVLPTFLGKVLIESSALKEARSLEGARGIMQLSRPVLEDCGIPERFFLHRIVQVDCALRLVEQNHRNLAPVFEEVFGHLPQEKRDNLYDLLLNQAYLVGVGRSIELLQDSELGAAASYFAANQEGFTAEDILVGLVYHNLGRRDLGLRSLYYVIDARLALAALCDRDDLAEWCRGH